ncbi:menaquinone biosynthesis protein [bacterium]|nr:menaquinone biosynthesis protein [bacterium]
MKLGVVCFCNLKPFIAAYEYGALPGPQLVYGPPRELSRLFASGAVQAAFIPAFDYLRMKETVRRVPGFGVACRGPVASVMLFHRLPFRSLSRIAVDQRSSTSVAMLDILLKHHFHMDAELVPADIFALERPEAVLVIGDRALLPMPGYDALDLGEAWFQMTGHAMVFGLFVAAGDSDAQATLGLLARGLDWAGENIQTIVARESARTRIPADRLADYLTNRILYQLGPRELAGLAQFEEYTRHAADKS